MPKKTKVDETNVNKKDLPDRIVLKKTVIQHGKYKFSEEEKRCIAKELATKHVDLCLVEDEKKSVMSDYKALLLILVVYFLIAAIVSAFERNLGLFLYNFGGALLNIGIFMQAKH